MSILHAGAIAVTFYALPNLALAFASFTPSAVVLNLTVLDRPASISASNHCSTNSSSQLLISNAEQAASFASVCTSFTGAIHINASENLALDGLRVIDGSLSIAAAPNTTVISSNSLANVTGSLLLSCVPGLVSLNFTSLRSVGSLYLHGLPSSLQDLPLLQTLENVNEIEVRSTELESLSGLNLQDVRGVNIQNNPSLTALDLRAVNVTDLRIANNSQELVVSLPNLDWVNNLSLANCSSVSIPSLTRVNNTLQLLGNSFSGFDNASAVRTIGDGLWINDNIKLANISLPSLRSIGGHVDIADNPQLSVLDRVSALESIGGNMHLDGNFLSISFPSLVNVNGSFVLNTTTELDCTIFDTYYDHGVIMGNYTCSNHTAGSSSKSRNSTLTTHISHSEHIGTKIALGVAIPLGILGVGSLVALYFLRRLRTGRKRRPQNEYEEKKGSLNTSTSSSLIEIGDSKALAELGRNQTNTLVGPEQRHELNATTAPTELESNAVDDTHGMNVIIGQFELEGDTVQRRKPET
ncbi:hypothetical protein AAFC00_004455 [Neodothiora populina]|uniref:Uncharacterized protein n=1 Tax=Neodothiora populina TaxID=2781224 RepID=A0ABR3P224_9PEZI